ncbi:MAG: NAD-dependent epimerase/dehydratase family protein, partial [Bryobacteraceae bacterium]
MRVSITGGTGLIGRELARRLLELGHEVRLTGRRRPPDLERTIAFVPWDALASPPPRDAICGADAVVHLAGEPIAQRWTPAARARMRASRIEGTQRLVKAMAACPNRPATLVSASAIGIYGDRGDEWLTEESPPGQGFLA